MKRKTLKRKISIVGILVFVSMIVYSCWQDEWSSNVTDEVIFDSNKELTIAKAEQWYNATNPSATTVRSLSADGRIPAKPNWNKAKESRKGDLEVVETTLMTSGSTFFMDNETKEKYELQDDLDKIYNVVRMVILKNLETGEIYNFIMVFIGTYDYLMHTTSFENNSYLHIAETTQFRVYLRLLTEPFFRFYLQYLYRPPLIVPISEPVLPLLC